MKQRLREKEVRVCVQRKWPTSGASEEGATHNPPIDVLTVKPGQRLFSRYLKHVDGEEET